MLRPGILSVVAAAVLLGCSTPEKPAPPTAPPVITSFTVDRAELTVGQSVNFSFKTERARSATLLTQAGVEVPVTFDEASGVGSATAKPSASTFYVLRVEGEGGRDSAFVQVAVDEGLKSVFFVVVPREVKAGDAVNVLWSADGGKNVAVKAGSRVLSSDATGNVLDTPTLSTTYTLSAERADGTTAGASVAVQVVPVISTFELVQPVVEAGHTVTLRWKTAGGERLVITEDSFGDVADLSTGVADGSFDFTLPETLGGAPVPSGLPLRFTLTLSTATPAQSVSRSVRGRVGTGPVIEAFDVPAVATANRPQTLSWSTLNADRVELYADGLLVAAPPVGQVLSGSFTVSALTADTEFTLRAYDAGGLFVSERRTVTVVELPSITSFAAPQRVASPTSPATLTWATQHAARLVLRIVGGPTLFFTDSAAQVATGSQPVLIAADTSFVLEAYNGAGDMVSAKASTTVDAPMVITFDPDPSPAGTPITAQWDVTALNPVDLPGLPGVDPQMASSPTAFIDLTGDPAATVLRFDDADDGMATFTAPDGFVFPFVTTQAATFSASVNGALVLGSRAVSGDNADLGAPDYTGPALLAPFWDDLSLGADGAVSYRVIGNAFPRTLVVQWTALEKPALAGTSLTFQVQLEETGEFHFVYQELLGLDTDSATIGAVESPNTYQHALGYETAGVVSTSQDVAWFTSETGRVADSHPLTLQVGRSFGFFAALSGGRYVAVRGRPHVFAANSILINEVMPAPSPSIAAGQWVELLNTTDEYIELAGLELVGGSQPVPFALDGLGIDPGGYLVVGQSTDEVDNGGAHVDAAWLPGELPLDAQDSLTLQIAGATPFVVSTIDWSAAPATEGTSVQAPEAAITATGPLTCQRTETYGIDAQVGTPGAANETCFEYTLMPIASAWEDISSTGNPVYAPGSTVDWLTTPVPFDLPAPFTYFGEAQSRAWVSASGHLAFHALTSATYSNRALPSSTSQPVGAIAPFWDDIENVPTQSNSNIYWARRDGYTVVEWSHFTGYSTSGDLNFQVKLFDTGVIEIHYGVMGGAAALATGTGATVWIERPSGTAAALPIGINQGVIAPNTGYRFSPKP